ncbi:MAG: polyribonucleotide nucleotidyltransferase [Candidatus Niyogibacteria bacterium RIFCSPLOWO2_01_FULL_45_48]|uniref:Polyribonucleotide nucleotidyltransferase n=1 Tax=Candidatus Niyogibacteria bacterium RIFCSPLOWO2_01_FULL_45_48 TaxID=1801724 RepID=A0A1G2EV34_9BACT|nr:MAG: polyribonucleotide nucleotidyltransferase [Candidatus Niyogibacteria bacterium RIFCSPLOWO2_01_FULL_45_48]
MQIKKYSTEIAGRKLEVEFSDLALHASGSVLVRYGKTAIFAAATMSKEARTGIDYFPLSVNYEEKFYAAGQILGSRFMKREGKPSDEAVLTGRLIDRTLRPLFSNKLRNEVQIVIMPLSIDGENDPDVPSIIAASLALATSDIPWAGPVSPLRLGFDGKKVIFNPTNAERENSPLDLVACAKEGKINMIEAGAKEVAEEDIMSALKEAVPEFEKIEKFQKEIISKEGKEKLEIKLPEEPEKLAEAFNKNIKGRLEDYIYISEKAVRNTRLGELKKEWTDWAEENLGEDSLLFADDIYEEAINDIVHKNIIEHEKRPDTRKLNELRDIFAKAGVLDRVHGSGIFYRGETHILSVATLGAPGDVQLIEGMEIQTKKRFMHHYNFPPFSTGETGRMGSPGRREIGHGALAERALEAVIPPKEIFPYTIRLVSEAMSSNGSTSMGSVCASTLALMDAGVPIKEPVAGIAMGLMMENDKKYKVLTDIQGPEDHHGDMDFKAAGTKNGISAIQMDVKVGGVTLEILSETLRDAKAARIKIMEVMLKEIAKPRAEVSPSAPKIIIMTINPDKIRDVVGPGGKTINKIIDETGAEIDIEQTGEIFITGRNRESAEKAAEAVKNLTHEYAVGEEFTGKVSRIFEFGAMVEMGTKQEGLVHISELAPYRVGKVRDVVNIGDEVPVKIISIDELGRVNLSIKQSSQYREKK